MGADYWYQSGHYGQKDEPRLPQVKPVPSLKELLANEEELIADYERRIREKEEKRLAEEEA